MCPDLCLNQELYQYRNNIWQNVQQFFVIFTFGFFLAPQLFPEKKSVKAEKVHATHVLSIPFFFLPPPKKKLKKNKKKQLVSVFINLRSIVRKTKFYSQVIYFSKQDSLLVTTWINSPAANFLKISRITFLFKFAARFFPNLFGLRWVSAV